MVLFYVVMLIVIEFGGNKFIIKNYNGFRYICKMISIIDN